MVRMGIRVGAAAQGSRVVSLDSGNGDEDGQLNRERLLFPLLCKRLHPLHGSSERFLAHLGD